MVVLEEDETIAGILSERDIVRVIAEGGRRPCPSRSPPA
jgi:CBS domain-containing protein